jgi:hypothetical protein
MRVKLLKRLRERFIYQVEERDIPHKYYVTYFCISRLSGNSFKVYNIRSVIENSILLLDRNKWYYGLSFYFYANLIERNKKKRQKEANKENKIRICNIIKK